MTCRSSADQIRHNSHAVFRARGGDKGLGEFNTLPARSATGHTAERLKATGRGPERGFRLAGEGLILTSDWPEGVLWSGAVSCLLAGQTLIDLELFRA